MCGVLLIDPKTPYNVGAVIRSCSIFDVRYLRWTGLRIEEALDRFHNGSHAHKDRLPREERFKDYSHVSWKALDESDWDRPIGAIRLAGNYSTLVPIAVEVLDGAENLDAFVHPLNALYVFGPEDGTLSPGIRAACHRFVRIRTATRAPLNLAQAVTLTLYDRYLKRQ